MAVPPDVSRAYSISGFLNMKQLGGALKLLRIKRRYYFAIDEISEELIYFKNELDFVQHRCPLGSFAISTAVVTIDEINQNRFIIHVAGRSIEFEAENEKNCRCWLETLANRYFESDLVRFDLEMLRRIKSCSSLPDQDSSYISQEQDQFRKYSVPDGPLKQNGLSITDDDNRITPPDDEINDWVSRWISKESFNKYSESSSVERSLDSASRTESCDETEKADFDEVEYLKEITNTQKKKIEELKIEMKSLTSNLEKIRERCIGRNEDDGKALVAQNKFLNMEILRMSSKFDTLELEVEKSKKDNEKLLNDLYALRCDYVYAIQSAIRIPLHDCSTVDVMSMKLIGGANHKARLVEMINEARLIDPSLPTLHSILQGFYVDALGFRIYFKEEPVALHYIACKLHQFYLDRSPMAKQHKNHWKQYLEKHSFIELNQETKKLCRMGIPNTLRATVWKMLISQQVDDLKKIYGKYYFRNLCNTQGGEEEKRYTEVHQKQINLDLLRTMPNNVHFMTANSKGVTQLLKVLHAFCLHNPQIGYCQGMNFLAATALLFVGPEDAFWFLIAMTERYFDKTYFDHNLTGVQADQEVLKLLLEYQYPKITKHLNSLEIDIASITLNWFIALFFDSVPFNSLLRIWDCFLLEGPKVLFRFAIILLGKHEEEILSRNDAIGIMKVSKAASKLTFDDDTIVEMAFKVPNLPSRAELKSMQLQYVEILREKLQRKSKRSDDFVNSLSFNNSSDKMISNIFVNNFNCSNGFIISGHHLLGKIAKFWLNENKAYMFNLDIEFDCRVMCICMVQEDLAYISLISGFLLVAQIAKNDDWNILWELKLPDVATFLLHHEETLFAGLSNGTLTVFENIDGQGPSNVQMWHIPLSSAPLTTAVIYDDLLIVATACKLISLDIFTLTTLSTTHVASSNMSSGVFYFDKIKCVSESNHGIFLTTDHSTLIQLWLETNCNLLYDITVDHKTRKPSFNETDNTSYIDSLLFFDSHLWVGSSDGYVFIYHIEGCNSSSIKYRLKKVNCERKIVSLKLSGTRRTGRLGSLIEDYNEDDIDQYYKATLKDTKTSRFSISIDCDKKEYKVSTADNDGNELDINESTQRRAILKKGFSTDSAVSVFSSEGNDVFHKTALENQDSNAPRKPELSLLKDRIQMSSTASSCTSLEFDDTFELYSDEEKSRRRVVVAGKKRQCSDLKRLALNRRDLSFDEPYFIPISGKEDHDKTADDCYPIKPTVKLNLQMKLKISDWPVQRIVSCGLVFGSKIKTVENIF